MRGEVCSRRNDKILPHTPIRKACRPAPAIPSGCTCGAALHRRAALCTDYGAGMVWGASALLCGTVRGILSRAKCRFSDAKKR
nr:MAG TPA: hypothetical protein [Caudoviricetes sp.]